MTNILPLSHIICMMLGIANGSWFDGFYQSGICDELCQCPKDLLEARTQALDCRDNNITSLPGDLNIPEGITKIDFSRNYIEKISPSTFTSSVILEIDFSGNRLSILPEGVFKSASNLQTLIFKNNKIKAIDEYAFIGLKDLKKLDLSYNEINLISSHVFAELPNLEELNLDFNPLVDVNGIVLGHNPALQSLHLSAVGITVLHPEFLSRNLTNLKKLKLAYNHIMDIPSKTFFHVSDSLSELDLSGNPIQSLATYSFYGLSNLRKLRLDQLLKLERIEAYAFGDLIHLETITLRYLPRIAFLDPKAFYSNKNGNSSAIQVEDLTLSFTILNTLPENLLNWDKLRYVELRYNHWTCDCNMQWLKNTTLLKRLGKSMVCSMPFRLRGHKIIDIPKEKLSCKHEITMTENQSAGFVIGLLIAGIGVSLGTVAILVYWRQGWLCRRPPGQYKHISRGVGEITIVDEMEWDNKDLQRE